MIRLTIPSLDAEDFDAVRRVLATGFLVQGAEVKAFEAALSAYTGAPHVVAVANCTAALHLALLALDIRAGDRVAVAAYSWPATANVIVLCGAEPVFVDVDPATSNMDPAALDGLLRRTPVKAVLPVHTFGGMADMARISSVARQHGVPVVEDAACALGAALNDRQAGTWGSLGCFSFHPRKAITTGEGGAVVTSDPALARRLRILRNHGQDPDAPTPDFVAAGFNLRLTEFQAALGTSQMGKLDRIIAARRAAAERYDGLLEGSGIRPPTGLPGSRHVYQSYVVQLPATAQDRRDAIVSRLRAGGIETTIGTYHIPLTSFYRRTRGFGPGAFPATDSVAARSVSLPLYEGITATMQSEVVGALRDASGPAAP